MNLLNIWGTFVDNLKDVIQIPETIKSILTNPLYIITILGCIILIALLLHARKIHFTTKMITRIGLAIAITFILHAFRIIELPNGVGSITLGSFIPIMIISIMYGPEVGMFTGFTYGVLRLMMGGYLLNPIQVLFDYPLPFMCLGIVGFFKNNKFLGAIIAVFFKFICHFISGVAFFGQYAPEGMSPWLYSLIANGQVQGIECIICLVVLAVLPIDRILREVNRNTSSAF